MGIMNYFISFLSRQVYFVVLVFALSIAIALPHIGQLFSPYATIFLQIIFFLSALKLDIKSTFKKDIKNAKHILIATFFILVLLPVITYGVATVFVPQFALALLLLSAMPAGMASVLLAEVVGGSVGFALILTMTTSLLSPFTIPFVIKLLAGATIVVPLFSMFVTLVTVVVTPFMFAQVVRYFLFVHIQKTFVFFQPTSLILLGLLILGIVSKQSEQILMNAGSFSLALFVLFIFFFILHIVGYFGLTKLSHEDRLANTVCIAYMNFTLAIYIADKFFPSPEVLIPVVLAIFPWSISIIVFKAVVSYYKKS